MGFCVLTPRLNNRLLSKDNFLKFIAAYLMKLICTKNKITCLRSCTVTFNNSNNDPKHHNLHINFYILHVSYEDAYVL